jgi:hypothetical protein
MNRLEELQFWRQFFRDQKSDHLRSYRRYKKICGEDESITRFMQGFAEGYTSPISVMDTLIKHEEVRNGNS